MKIPVIQDNAFFNNTATTVIKPEFGPLNDHCYIKLQGIWHFLTSRGRHAIGGSSIIDPMRLTDPIPDIQKRIPEEYWAPCAIIKDEKVFIFYATPVVPLKPDWKNFAYSMTHGGLFRMVLAEAPLPDISQLAITHELFSEDGGARDPFVFWDNESNQWIMYYAKRLYNNTDHIEGGIAYRTSIDLIHWSEQKGYVIRGLYYEDKIKDEVTVTIGTAESPQLIQFENFYYLFVTHIGYKNYHRTKVWVSDNPFSFTGSPITTLYAHAPEIILENSQWYISNCGQHHKEFGETGNALRAPGIEIAKLNWDKPEADNSS